MPTVNVDQDVYDQLRAAVFAKHGKLRGVLQDEATAALREHVKNL